MVPIPTDMMSRMTYQYEEDTEKKETKFGKCLDVKKEEYNCEIVVNFNNEKTIKELNAKDVSAIIIIVCIALFLVYKGLFRWNLISKILEKLRIK